MLTVWNPSWFFGFLLSVFYPNFLFNWYKYWDTCIFLFASIWLAVTSCSKIVFSNFVSSIWSSWYRDTSRVCVADRLLPQGVWGHSWPLASTCHRAGKEPSRAPSGLNYPLNLLCPTIFWSSFHCWTFRWVFLWRPFWTPVSFLSFTVT